MDTNNIEHIQSILPDKSLIDIELALDLFNNDLEKTINYLINATISKSTSTTTNNNDSTNNSIVKPKTESVTTTTTTTNYTTSSLQEEEDENERLFKEFMKNEQNQLEEEHRNRLHECSICYSELTIGDFYIMDECEHRFCRDCLVYHYKTQVGAMFPNIKCPHTTCKKIVTYEEVKHILDGEWFEKYDNLLLKNSLESDKRVRYCPFVDCGVPMVNNKTDDHCQCPKCSYSFCFKCRDEWHEGYSCQEWLEIKEELNTYTYVVDDYNENEPMNNISNGNRNFIKYLKETRRKGLFGKRRQYKKQVHQRNSHQGKFLEWAKKNTTQCPGCYSLIQKSYGCDHMTCLCGQEFCFSCGAVYKTFLNSSKKVQDSNFYHMKFIFKINFVGKESDLRIQSHYHKLENRIYHTVNRYQVNPMC
eukprot:gene1429-1803_t